jgi:penicillin V acylase-like amidase (Ntn superfamily)
MVKYTYIICIASLFTGALYSCTGISIKAKDGTTVYARTLEFAQELHSEVLYTPSGYTFEGQTPFKDVVKKHQVSDELQELLELFGKLKKRRE